MPFARRSAPRLRVVAWAAILAALGAWPRPARAQLSVTRLYFGVNRPIPVQVAAPRDAADAPLSVALLAPVSAALIDRAPVRAGLVDLSALFPRLWDDPRPTLLYAQL